METKATETSVADVTTLEENLLEVKLPEDLPDLPTPRGTLREARRQFERNYILRTMRNNRWHIASAAMALGIKRPNLYRKLRQLNIYRRKPLVAARASV